LTRKPNKTRTSSRSSKRAKFIDVTKDIIPEVPDIQLRNRLTAKSDNQKNFIKTIIDNDITFCQGLAGSGKTHIAIGIAIEWLLTDKVGKIVISRPVVEAGEKLGYLPGTAEEKLHPYLIPVLDEINNFISMADYARLKNENKIEIVPLGLMRGRNFHDCFIVADECQNATYEQIKMLITRIGFDSKMVLTGDAAQSDLYKNQKGGFVRMMDLLGDIDGVGLAFLEASDIIRNPIIAKILERLEVYEGKS
jgi:phosphate starvation-inducible PhoH-like protein